MRVVFASVRSSPGVTTTMLAFASVWPGRLLLVEACEDGGALAARFGLGSDPGLTTLAAALRRDIGAQALDGHCQSLPDTDGRLRVLVGPPAPESARPLLETAAQKLAGLLGDVDGDVLVDVGRLSLSPPAGALVAAADRLVVVVRPRVEELQTLAHRLPALRGWGVEPQLVLVGNRPYGPVEVAATLGVGVLGAVADDRPAADVLAGVGPSRRLRRSGLLRSATTLVDGLRAAIPTRPPAPAPGQSGRVVEGETDGAGWRDGPVELRSGGRR